MLQIDFDSDSLFELSKGQVVELPRMGAYETAIASSLMYSIEEYFMRTKPIGRIVFEMPFCLNSVEDIERRPRVAFVSYDRWPKRRRIPRTDAWNVVPELAVEFVGRRILAEAVLGKLRDYFRSGVRLAWLIYAEQQVAHIYKSFTEIEVLQRSGYLKGGDILPGFDLSLESLFGEELEEQPVD